MRHIRSTAEWDYLDRFKGGLVFKAHRLLYHSTLSWRVIKKKKKKTGVAPLRIRQEETLPPGTTTSQKCAAVPRRARI